MFEKILIANRGEIACRVIKTAQRMGVKTVAIYSDADANARHVRLADEAYHIGGAAAADSYLKADKVLEIAKTSGAKAIHPGYGFLSENAEFSEGCAKAGITFIGPSAKSILAMGLKDKAKQIMQDADVPVVPGYEGEKQEADFLQKQADEIGYPVLIKAVAGGGGKGMRKVESAKEFKDALQSCQREAKSSFGDDHVLIEKYITKPRHIELQVFGDTHGNVVHLFERDCSLQRRHQKVVEEAPAPGISEEMRSAMGNAAVKAAEAIDYYGAGTIEFIVDVSKGIENAPFYFMEMNTRLQVEHPVTELITQQDLVEWQLRVAAGEKLPLSQDDLSIHGHSFEVRLYAEDPSNEFLPQTGTLQRLSVGKDHFIRLDTGVETGDEVTIHYDPMIAKLIVWGDTRDNAAANMKTALEKTDIAGLLHNQEFLHNIFCHESFLGADLDTGFIERHEAALIPDHYNKPLAEDLALASVFIMSGMKDAQQQDDTTSDPWDVRDNWRLNTTLEKTIHLVSQGEMITLKAICKDHDFSLSSDALAEDMKLTMRAFEAPYLRLRHDGSVIEGALITNGRQLTICRNGRSIPLQIHDPAADAGEDGGEGRITAPMPGKIITVLVTQGDEVAKDQPLLIMEAMKMEMTIRAGTDGVVDELPVAENDQVSDGTLLISIKGEDAA